MPDIERWLAAINQRVREECDKEMRRINPFSPDEVEQMIRDSFPYTVKVRSAKADRSEIGQENQGDEK